MSVYSAQLNKVILGELVEYSSSSLQLIDASGWDVSDGLTLQQVDSRFCEGFVNGGIFF